MTNTPTPDERNATAPDLSLIEQETARAQVDEDPLAINQRDFTGRRHITIATLCVAYSVFHLMVMNVYPLETWAYRLSHVGGGLFLGFLLFGSSYMHQSEQGSQSRPAALALLALATLGVLYGLVGVAAVWINGRMLGNMLPPGWAMASFGLPLTLGTGLAILHGWLFPQRDRHAFAMADIVLAIAALVATAYLIFFARQLQLRAGMPMALPAICGPRSPVFC